MSNHFIVKCAECNKVIRQCRCPSCDKTVTFEICSECEKHSVFKPDIAGAVALVKEISEYAPGAIEAEVNRRLKKEIIAKLEMKKQKGES